MSLNYTRFLLVVALAILALIGWEDGVLADTMKEARAIWVVRWDTASPEKIEQAVKYARDNNFNVLVVQVRGRGDAFYKSNFEPRAEYLEKQPLDFDPLALYVQEGHKAGLQIHAWLNTHYTWGSGDPPKSPDHIVNKHPEWLMRNSENAVTLNPAGQSEGAYTCPSNSEVKEHVREVFLDVVKNYDVDGINFDYVRYPSGDYCYCDGCLARFKAEIVKEIPPERVAALEGTKDRLAFVQAFPQRWDDWRRKQVTDLVGQVYRRAKDIKPGIVVSADVFPDFDDAYNHRFQDWKLWLKMGILDVLMPMIYTTNTDTYAKQVQDAVSSSNGRHVYGGIGQWQIPVESAIEKTLKAREVGAQGINLFAYGPATKDGTDDEYLRKMKEAVFQEPATVPKMDWIK